jgi:cytochrome c2
MRRALLIASFAVAATIVLVTSGCGGGAVHRVEIRGARPDAAPALIEAYGCGACHTISGITGADAHVGPSLVHLSQRATIAGVLPNTPENLVRWLMSPQQIAPGTIMPDLGVGEPEARDIAAYLYSH